MVARIACLVVAASLPLWSHAAITLSVVDVPTRGFTTRVAHFKPDAPVATVISLRDDGIESYFDIGTHDEYLALRGISVVYVDPPSDQGQLTREFRQTPEHAADIQEVMKYVRAQGDEPIWVMGRSNGSISAAYVGVNLPAALPFGVILESTVTVGKDSVLNMDLASLGRPVFILAHAEDACTETPPSQADVLKSRLTTSPAVEIRILEGGIGEAAQCRGGHHNFAWQADDVADAESGFIKKYNPLVPPDLNQRGLSGSWYEPATSGQGIELEVFPGLVDASTGLVSGGWFTFDSGAAGGADKQRWYTLDGPMVSRASAAPVTIYRNVGGNFDAPPVTGAQVVGTGTLTFPTCDTGRFAYAFSDGRSGTIPLARLTTNVECSATTLRTTNRDFGFSGNWFAADTSGQGLVVEVNPANRALFFAWYTYAPDGETRGDASQRWYTGLGDFVPGATAASVTLYETTGGIFATSTPLTQSTVAVGTATLKFSSCDNASLAYVFNGGSNAGRSGTIALTRVGQTPTECTH